MGAIADMIRAGVDPDLIERIAMEMVEAVRHGLPAKSSAAIRQQRYRDRKKASCEGVTRYVTDVTNVTDVTDLSPKVSPQRDINQTPLPNPLSKPKRAKARTAMQDDQQPTQSDLDAARAAGVSEVVGEWKAFRDYYISKGNLMADWSAAWRTWLRNSKKFGSRFSSKGNGTFTPPAEKPKDAPVFIGKDSEAWERAIALEPRKAIPTKHNGLGAYFSPDIAAQVGVAA